MINSEDLYKEIGQRIRCVREERKLTQAELAAVVLLTRTSITNIEHGRQKLLLHTLYDIAAALAVEPCNLLPEVTNGVNKHVLGQSISGDLSTDEQDWIRSIVIASEQED
jgi:transcriptional regulator with XRE-family HTH domain